MQAATPFNFHGITADGKILFSRGEANQQMYVRDAAYVQGLSVSSMYQRQKDQALLALTMHGRTYIFSSISNQGLAAGFWQTSQGLKSVEMTGDELASIMSIAPGKKSRQEMTRAYNSLKAGQVIPAAS